MSQQLLRRAWNFIDTIKQVYPEHWSPEEQVLLDDLMKAESAGEYERGFIDGMQKQMQSSVDKAVNAMSKREWVGLTDEEIDKCCDFPLNALGMKNVRKIEAKLRSKNT